MTGKRWLWLGLLLAGFAVGGQSDGRRQLGDRQVVGLPTDFDAGARTEPYAGPHPSRLQRPDETFRFPIMLGQVGPDEPLFAGPKRYPFICDTASSGLGAPLADNSAGVGTPVLTPVDSADGAIKGTRKAAFSKDCLAPTKAWYFYKPVGEKHFARWNGQSKDEVETITVNGVRVPFILRVEMGTINRFIYLIAVLKGAREIIDAPAADRWNRRLIYQFYGGVGIGHRQGRANVKAVLEDRREQLAQGYAVIASTGTTTRNHFDIWLAEDTALRVKRQFVALYGEPDYTVGVGASGGAIQQYLLAQNRPGLIDAAIAQYSYPDMITQTIPVFDCELLEYYFDVTDGDNRTWRKAENRSWIEGFNASNQHESSGGLKRIDVTTRVAFMMRGEALGERKGATECVIGWRGLTPLVLNPRFAPFESHLTRDVFRQVRWSYFEDLKRFFGTDARGYARIPWDNVGVQYGLRALQRKQITPEQFLRLNARIGSWKTPADMQPEHYWLVDGGESELREFSPWSAHNINTGPDSDRPAPRFEGDREAIAAAYRSGQVFLGRVDIPVIDERLYLEAELDMHHAAASFSARARMIAAQGDAGSQAIWVSDKAYDPTPRAFAAIDQWLRAKRARPELSWAEVRPGTAADRCFDARGRVMFNGDRVWDGSWNRLPGGACMRAYPIYGNSRMVAGDEIHGDRFKCALQTVSAALAGGVYEPVAMSAYKAQLERIFPNGVCDYRQPDQGRPKDLADGDTAGGTS
ncbi:DUF6351 family protein [Aromatoleum toluclasticum]|uniref:DUF6351 family protein n=1 Tax=Aromatoleum toluclasticum TaxID=92003 RepID=UPI001D187BB2|nr:DUF6351 family protein [Aromatoleum toluclasticum]MCC4117361.1 DUF6351 family protein [Aromatoleum toluclasticum]